MKLEPLGASPVPQIACPYASLAVLGAGSWGTALAATARNAGVAVTLWGRSDNTIQTITTRHENTRYLPGVTLPKGLMATTDMAAAVQGAEAVVLVVPSSQLREVARQLAGVIAPGTPVAVCAKGIERDTGLLMTQIAEAELGPRPVGVLSGPTFARETALGHPTAATVAFPFSYADRISPEESTAARFAVSFSTEAFRTYVSDDVTGVEIGGAVKNVIAIACGMMTGAGFAENTRAALITRGLDEMMQLAVALGGRRETLTGLSGLGDLSLTCSSLTSRNMALGEQLGRGIARGDCFEGRPVVVEGEHNAVSVTDLAGRLGLAMPICEAVRAIVVGGRPIGETFAELWARPIESEVRAMELCLDHPASDKAVAALAQRMA
ncbi:NAD(P)H-dependent glycerol-3-phosphate dehydrogenase [Anianabacter salinae]|uniref:NAD(P)H-dependent glycerol-3-phosphate dehydrogenase n=1 Tax=Anianabacter salinae TaxID=2851023 RepID=UPI00225E0695|nr:NAD(P)H-dependent glycerol-3-phosphate dehydrogenase [Anianabacter salinae]MBV0911146.1 NAD(P)-dependent glycerol-3-phosphate dehydrogenase [Anianabacter salinae]